jgi:hypothetical protein
LFGLSALTLWHFGYFLFGLSAEDIALMARRRVDASSANEDRGRLAPPDRDR